MFRTQTHTMIMYFTISKSIIILLCNLKEWRSFLHELHDAIQQQLTESHVKYFSDLSEPEKELFMQRATKAIEGGTCSCYFKMKPLIMIVKSVWSNLQK